MTPIPWETVASSSPVWFSHWATHQKQLEGLLGHRWLGPAPVSKLGCNLRIFFAHKFPGDAAAAYLGTPSRLENQCLGSYGTGAGAKAHVSSSYQASECWGTVNYVAKFTTSLVWQ